MSQVFVEVINEFKKEGKKDRQAKFSGVLCGHLH